MPEVLHVATGIFIRLGVAFAIFYGLYRTIRHARARLPEGLFGKPKESTWEGIQLLYTVPTGILLYIMVVIFIVLIVSRCSLAATDRWLRLPGDTDDTLFLLSCAGIFSSFVFGLYQDHPPTRLKILGVIAVFSALAGIAAG